MSIIEPGLVSTIIPVFNRPEMIITAVQSVLAQSYRPIEIIIIDDGSTDHTQKIVSDLAFEHAEVVSLRQKNVGPGAAREKGRQEAKGEYIQYLDSDDQLLPDKFQLQVQALKEEPDSDVAYGKTDRRHADSNKLPKAWKRTGQIIETMFPRFLESRWWGTSTPLYRRAVTDSVGAWLPLINEEDWEYDCRVAALGGKLVFVDSFVSTQYVHDDHLSADGGTLKSKLRDRCDAREHIYASAISSTVVIPAGTMNHFAKSVFLLARHCAQQNMQSCVERMLDLANKSRGHKTVKQKMFTLLGKLFGWPTATRLARIIESKLRWQSNA